MAYAPYALSKSLASTTIKVPLKKLVSFTSSPPMRAEIPTTTPTQKNPDERIDDIHKKNPLAM